MDVHVLHLAGVDALARFGIGLIRQPQMDSARHGQRAVEFRAGRSAGKDADLEFLPAKIRIDDAPRQRDRHSLGIARAGEPAHADLVAVLNQSRSFFGVHDAVCET